MNIETTKKRPNRSICAEFAHETDGKWNASDKSWMFDKRDRSKVEDICVKLFNYLKAGDKTVTIQFPGTLLTYNDNAVELLGSKIAYRPGRDSRVRMVEGCVLLQGKFKSSSGSMRYPDVGDVEDLVFEYRNFPESRLSELDSIAWKDAENEECWYKVIDNSIDVEALKAEKEALLKRLNEIDKLLNL